MSQHAVYILGFSASDIEEHGLCVQYPVWQPEVGLQGEGTAVAASGTLFYMLCLLPCAAAVKFWKAKGSGSQ